MHGQGAKELAVEGRAQATVEYALVAAVLLAVAVGCAAIWRAGERGVFAGLIDQAASHGLTGLGLLDIALY